MSYHLCTLPRGRMSVSSWNSVVHFATHSRTLSLFPVTFFALLSKGILFKEEIGGEKHMVHPNTRADLTFHGTECMHSDNLLGWEDLSSGDGEPGFLVSDQSGDLVSFPSTGESSLLTVLLTGNLYFFHCVCKWKRWCLLLKRAPDTLMWMLEIITVSN